MATYHLHVSASGYTGAIAFGFFVLILSNSIFALVCVSLLKEMLYMSLGKDFSCFVNHGIVKRIKGDGLCGRTLTL